MSISLPKKTSRLSVDPDNRENRWLLCVVGFFCSSCWFVVLVLCVCLFFEAEPFCVALAGLELTEPLASRVLGLKDCATSSGLSSFYKATKAGAA